MNAVKNNGTQLEEWALEHLHLHYASIYGKNIEVYKPKSDDGIDVMVRSTTHGLICAAQCKDYHKKVGYADLGTFLSEVMIYEPRHAVIIVRNGIGHKLNQKLIKLNERGKTGFEFWSLN